MYCSSSTVLEWLILDLGARVRSRSQREWERESGGSCGKPSGNQKEARRKSGRSQEEVSTVSTKAYCSHIVAPSTPRRDSHLQQQSQPEPSRCSLQPHLSVLSRGGAEEVDLILGAGSRGRFEVHTLEVKGRLQLVVGVCFRARTSPPGPLSPLMMSGARWARPPHPPWIPASWRAWGPLPTRVLHISYNGQQRWRRVACQGVTSVM